MAVPGDKTDEQGKARAGRVQDPMEEALLRIMRINPDLAVRFFHKHPVAAVIVAQDGTILFVNEQAELDFGYHRSEMVGKSIDMLVPDDARADHVGHRGMFGAAPRRRPMGLQPIELGRTANVRFRRKDGTEVPARIELDPTMTSSGLLVFASVIPMGPPSVG